MLQTRGQSFTEVQMSDDNDRVVLTAVRQGDESYYESMTSDDEEGQLSMDESQQNNSDQLNQGLEPPPQNLDSDHPGRHECNDQVQKVQGWNSDLDRDLGKNKTEEKQWLDQDIHSKLTELHKLMTREDMQRSAGIIEDCLAVCIQKKPSWR